MNSLGPQNGNVFLHKLLTGHARSQGRKLRAPPLLLSYFFYNEIGAGIPVISKTIEYDREPIDNGRKPTKR